MERISKNARQINLIFLEAFKNPTPFSFLAQKKKGNGVDCKLWNDTWLQKPLKQSLIDRTVSTII